MCLGLCAGITTDELIVYRNVVCCSHAGFAAHTRTTGQKCNCVWLFLGCIIWMLEIKAEFRTQHSFAFLCEKTHTWESQIHEGLFYEVRILLTICFPSQVISLFHFRPLCKTKEVNRTYSSNPAHDVSVGFALSPAGWCCVCGVFTGGCLL